MYREKGVLVGSLDVKNSLIFTAKMKTNGVNKSVRVYLMSFMFWQLKQDISINVL